MTTKDNYNMEKKSDKFEKKINELSELLNKSSKDVSKKETFCTINTAFICMGILTVVFLFLFFYKPQFIMTTEIQDTQEVQIRDTKKLIMWSIIISTVISVLCLAGIYFMNNEKLL